MEKINFSEIYTEYDYFNLILDNEKVKLVYRIRQYSLVTNLNKINGLRRNDTNLKIRKRMNNNGEVVVAYYKPYTEKLVSLKSKKKLIELLLNRVVDDEGLTLGQYIENIWHEKNAHKITTTPLMDKEAKILDTLSSYFIGGVEGEGILTQDLSRVIQNKEVSSFSADRGNTNISSSSRDVEAEDYNDSEYTNTWMFNKMSKKKHSKYVKHAPKRWRNSKTYKLNNLYSYNDHKDEYLFYNWLTEQWTGISQEYHYKIDRLINPEDEYVAKWCLVDTENEFSFKGERLRIDDIVEQYEVGEDGSYSMDAILVLEQNDKRYYFDQNIDPIQNQKIKILSEWSDVNGIKDS